jgi:hypothetical protein
MRFCQIEKIFALRSAPADFRDGHHTKGGEWRFSGAWGCIHQAAASSRPVIGVLKVSRMALDCSRLVVGKFSRKSCRVDPASRQVVEQGGHGYAGTRRYLPGQPHARGGHSGSATPRRLSTHPGGREFPRPAAAPRTPQSRHCERSPKHPFLTPFVTPFLAPLRRPSVAPYCRPVTDAIS